MTDQRSAAQQAYTLSHFNFLQQKPKLKNTCDLPAEASRAADVSGPDSILASQSMTSKPRAAESQSVLVRLPDAPALPVRKTSTPLPPANFARSEMCLQSGKLVDHKVPSHQQQPLLPLRPSPSTSAGWKRVIRPGPAATKKDDPPLLSRLAKLTNASTLSVASGSHVAGVLPAHVPQERHSHGSAVPPAAQPQQNHDPAASTARHDLLSQQQASALGFSSQSPTAEGSLQSTPSSVPADKPKSILRSRLRLQRPQPEATLTPVTTLPPGTIISSHHADAVPGATQQLQESEPLAKPAAKPTDPMPWCSFGPQPAVQEAAASSCVQTGSSIKQALGKVQDQTAAAQRVWPRLKICLQHQSLQPCCMCCAFLVTHQLKRSFLQPLGSCTSTLQSSTKIFKTHHDVVVCNEYLCAACSAILDCLMRAIGQAALSLPLLRRSARCA